MGGHKTIRSSSMPVVKPAYPPLTVTGDGDPNPNGVYVPYRIFNGKMSYKLNQDWFIFWDNEDAWFISQTEPTDWPYNCSFYRVQPEPQGIYFYNPPATGEVTVT